MRLRKEQVLLIATVLLLGLFLWRGSGEVAMRTGRRSAKQLELVHHPAPEVALALPQPRDAARLDRDLFSEPRDERPLAPLALEEPPPLVLTALLPPPEPTLAPREFGRWLRADPSPRPVPGLFASGEDEGEEGQDAGEVGGGLLADLAGLQPSGGTLSAEERQARLESWKKVYDWIRINEVETLFGRIRNPERFGLRQRPGEAIQFTEIVPETGAERFPGMPPASYERARVIEFGFADTASNFVQERRRDFAPPLTPGQYGPLLEFAERCVELRLEAPEALGVAARMYQLAAEIAGEDPAPRLGLARCYEAGFELDKAYQTYLELIERFAHRPEVHVRLAELEARLRLFESAEERLERAARIGRLDWRVHWSRGRFLYGRGRFDEALAAMRIAYEHEPADPEAKDERAGIRTDLGAALFAVGRADEARQAFERALQADPGSQRAQAGVRSALRLLGRAPTDAQAFGGDETGFELLLARGLDAMAAGDAEAARDQLRLAAAADPLREWISDRTLSWLAETSGYPEEAWSSIDRAWQGNPTDAWTLYQRGRILEQRDDQQGARESFVAALDVELDFSDALVALGRQAYRSGELDAAEMYLERALVLDPGRAEVHALLGLDRLRKNDIAGARDAFEASIAADPSQPLARVGLAWVQYRRGETEKAIQGLAEMEDQRARSGEPEGDPWRRWAKAQIARIQDHQAKVLWADRFERRELRRGWDTEQASGPEVHLADGELVIEGAFHQSGRARFWRQLPAPDFVSIEMDVTVDASTNAMVGLFLSKEKRVGVGETQVQGIVAVARRKDGALAVRTEDRAAADPLWQDVPPIPGGEAWWPAGKPVRLRIERLGEGSDATGRISVDGVPVAGGFGMRALSSSSGELRVGLFVEGQTGLPARVVADDVEMVYKVRR